MFFKKKITPYNSIEKKGITALLSIIVLLQVIYFFYPFSKKDKSAFDINSVKIRQFQNKIDSLKQVKIANKKAKKYPFNPSFLTDYKASRLGLSIDEIDRLLAHQKAGKYINSATHFQQITKISDSLLAVISPYFKFPDWITKKQNTKIYSFNPSFLSLKKGIKLGMSKTEINRLLTHRKAGKYINSSAEFQKITGITDALLNTLKPYFKFPDWVIERNKKANLNNDTTQQNNFLSKEKHCINAATAIELQKINGVDEKLATRIIKYRKLLKGYSLNAQLYEVWHLKPDIANKILAHFSVINKPNITKININTASFKEILHLPYIDYELTKKIFQFRDEVAELQELKELKKIDSFPVKQFDRISLYLKAE